jgi:hypothetical protein
MKIYTHQMDDCPTQLFHKIYLWCRDQFGDEHGWTHQYPTFYFRNEQDYILFLLKWA